MVISRSRSSPVACPSIVTAAFGTGLRDRTAFPNLQFNPDLLRMDRTIMRGVVRRSGDHRRGEKFTAVIASNDRSAIGVLDGWSKNGYLVPQDVALIGFDDRLEARALVPSVTQSIIRCCGLGYQAVEFC